MRSYAGVNRSRHDHGHTYKERGTTIRLRKSKGASENASIKIKRPGAFSAKARAAGMSTRAYAEREQHAPGRLGKQARLAKTLMGFKH